MPHPRALVTLAPRGSLAVGMLLLVCGWAASAAESQRPARIRLPEPPAEAAADELFAYVDRIAAPELKPESRGRLRYHRRRVAALTAAAADLILAQVPEDDPRHARATALKREAEAASRPGQERSAPGARPLALPDNPLALEGTLLDGTAFDHTGLAGKVVLIDFWATWCGPCVAEIPRVRDAYDRYHDRGFAVVGVSLDEDREALEAFVVEKEIPWPIIVDARNDSGGLADRYGVTAIPTMILVGRDGAVLSTEARGRRLEELLAEQFAGDGPPAEGRSADASRR
jgi:thiol-disulfide isomerase/thioredoxin